MKKPKLSSTTHILQLPNHITIDDIFSKLPITSLLQCRCVCRSWRLSLSDPHFATYLLSLTPPSLLIKHRRTFSLVPQNGVVLHLPTVDPTFRSPHIDVVGSSHGLLAVRHNVAHFYISNPILGDFLALPRPRVQPNSNSTLVCGFGFSSVSNVFKLVVVSVPWKGSEGVVEVMILTVGSGSGWRSIGTSAYPCWIQKFGVCVNGVLHWIVGTGETRLKLEDCCVICALDVESEEFRVLPLPRGSFVSGTVELELGVLGGCLTVNACYNNWIFVWVMKEYGVKESWSKEYDIKGKVGSKFRSHPNVPRVLRVTEEGKVWLFHKHELKAYTPGNWGLVKLEADRMPLVVHGAFVHTPSFVSLKHAIAGKHLKGVFRKKHPGDITRSCTRLKRFRIMMPFSQDTKLIIKSGALFMWEKLFIGDTESTMCRLEEMISILKLSTCNWFSIMREYVFASLKKSLFSGVHIESTQDKFMALEVAFGAFLTVLVDRLASRHVVALLRGKKVNNVGLLRKLKQMLLQANAGLGDAEEKQTRNKAVRAWLSELKDALNEADILLNEIGSEALRRMLEEAEFGNSSGGEVQS